MEDTYGLVHGTCDVDEGIATVNLTHATDGRWLLVRRIKANPIITVVGDAHITIDGRLQDVLLDEDLARKVFTRLSAGENYSDCFVFDEGQTPTSMEHVEIEHRYTSTGMKLWRHADQLWAYKNGEPGSVVYAQISPEGACNLKCPYCCVTYRMTSKRISLPVIKQYVEDLCSRGLKAVLLTGGGEPTTYKDFNELVQWMKHEKGLKLSLITNGTMSKRVEDETWKAFSWIRVSTNMFNGWQEKIDIPRDKMADDCVIGMSILYTGEHEVAKDEPFLMGLPVLKSVQKIADKIDASYVRLLPNCLLSEKPLLAMQHTIEETLKELGDDRFFRQNKHHGTPDSHVCHMAYFRPYLSEQPWTDGEPGTVYPCDSVVDNEGAAHFKIKYGICKPQDILKFLDRQIDMQFDPMEACTGCVFTRNVNLLGRWKAGEEGRIAEFANKPIEHEEFV